MAPRRNSRATAVATIAAPVRCAIYTRKSTTQGLDAEFTTLHNQRERGEAFIASQGWSVVATPYDDGGFSGGNMERPALQRLLQDVEAGLVHAIVVIRLDRLSRNLVHFGRIHEFLEKHGVALVSVSESINTKSPHGRMMVNVLLSFAQYERELVGERTRDKLHAARRRGKFVGGHPVLGYDHDPNGRRLVVNQAEVEQVRAIFQLFLEKRSMTDTAAELNRRGWTLKRWTTKDGKAMGGGRFNRVSLHRMLTNQVYVGKVEFEGTIYDGEHEGIVPQKLFRDVQNVLSGNQRTRGASARNKYGFLLRGILRCAGCDSAMVAAPVKARGRLHKYYRCCSGMKAGGATCPAGCLKADKIEGFVVDQIRRIGADPELQDETFRHATLQLKARRRGLKLETKRLADDLGRARADVERLVATVSRLDGPAADAVAAELAKAQEHVGTLEKRQTEVAAEMDAVKTQDVDREAIARALAGWDELWSVLLTPERERILHLLIERVDYRGDTGELVITWRLSGFGELATEIGREW